MVSGKCKAIEAPPEVIRYVRIREAALGEVGRERPRLAASHMSDYGYFGNRRIRRIPGFNAPVGPHNGSRAPLGASHALATAPSLPATLESLNTTASGRRARGKPLPRRPYLLKT